jgi:hypothetical protein
MPDMNRGLDLSVFETTSEGESDRFRSFYAEKLGTPHRGLNFWLDVGRPDVLKRYRAYADDGTPGGLETVRKVGGFSFFVSYALSGYAVGIRYLVRMYQTLGFTRAQILEGLAVAFLYNGPRGSETVAEALADYEWIEPAEPAVFFDGWAPDPGAFSSGMDFGTREVLDGEMDLLDDWYLRTIGEIPPYVGFLRQHRPRLLKSWRSRYENILVELPKQVMPYSQLHYNVMRGFADGIRESVLLARAFGMTKEQVYEPLFSPMVNTGPEAYSIVSQAAGDVLAADWPSERKEDR